MAYPYPRRRFPNPPSTATTTGGEHTFNHSAAYLSQHQFQSAYEAMRMCGGPLDATDYLPAGSWNSTVYRCGPWDVNDGTGQACPHETFVLRQPIEESTE